MLTKLYFIRFARCRKSMLLMALIIIPLYNAIAQSPEYLNYQAVIRNAHGMLIQESNIAMQISILRSSASGNVSYKETHATSTDANGLASIEIGNGTAIDGTLFDTINWGSSSYYIKVETDPDNGTNYSISGTFQLLSVPYALYAKSFSGDMQNRKITNLANPTDSSDAVTQKYISAIMDIMSLNGMDFVDFWIGSRSVAINDSIYFRDTSNMNAHSWQWNFDDGNSSTEKNPGHKFSEAGSYNISLTASNDIITHTNTIDSYIVAHEITAGNGLTDIDGNTYETIILGTQEWMSENLKATKFPDGTAISEDQEWDDVERNNTSYYYCWYNNDISTKDTYGAFYSFGAAVYGTAHTDGEALDTLQGICPDGWHLPRKDEWDTLVTYLRNNDYNYNLESGSRAEAKAISAKTGWYGPDILAPVSDGMASFDRKSNNSSGFSSIPAGMRSPYAFNYFSKYAYWWTATQSAYSDQTAYGWKLNYNSRYSDKYSYSKDGGFNVRCVKDQ